MEFKKYKLEDVMTGFKYGSMPKKDKIKNDGKYPIYTGYLISGYYDECNIEKETLIVVARGVGGTGDVKLTPDKCFLTNLSIALFNDEKIVTNKYIYYYYKISNLRYLDSGSAQSQITINDLKNVKILIPKIEEQYKIVKILNDIDTKIELNNQINDNLFKFAISYIKNKIEETEVPISKFAKIQGGYAFKSKDLLDDKTNNRIIKIKNLRSEINADVVNSQYVEDEVANSIDSKFKLNKGDVTIAMTGAELGKTGFIYGFDNYYLNQRVGVIRGKNKEGELYLKILFLSNEFQTLLNSKGYGSAQPNISTNDIESILINDIAEENLKDIYERLNSVYYRIISNCEENLNLEQLRDTLLPKLMNGEIDLDKIEI